MFILIYEFICENQYNLKKKLQEFNQEKLTVFYWTKIYAPALLQIFIY